MRRPFSSPRRSLHHEEQKVFYSVLASIVSVCVLEMMKLFIAERKKEIRFESLRSVCVWRIPFAWQTNRKLFRKFVFHFMKTVCRSR